MIALSCGCKLNLGLRILSRLPTGYHELETLFYPLAWPADQLLICQPAGNHAAREIVVCCDHPAINPEANLLVRAWRAFAAATCACPGGLVITLRKHIPVGAGLGGGSSDAACLLAWLNNNSPRPLSPASLAALAASLGADVPFFLYNRPCAASGIGDQLQPVSFASQGCYLVIVYPGIAIATHWAFAAWDAENSLTKARPAARKTCSKALDFACPENDLESPVFASFPELAKIKAELLALGAFSAGMSGSGSSIYGIFAARPAACAAAVSLRRHWPAVYVQKMRDFGM
ncbi:MAG: 4-(cytidine 5'-diphospho)-2-C-methyl-D-erythritol kinase [Desulfovibrio sp.]|nr:4-(cytidine 5'-diphospho)-2-C-methyl-D-erythritol kinase [Desulfovibrio sp.]